MKTKLFPLLKTEQLAFCDK